MSLRRWVPLASSAQVVALALGAGTNLLYARLLPAAEIGRFAITVAIATGLVVVADFGLQLLVTRTLAAGSLEAPAALGVVLWIVPAAVFCWALLAATTLVVSAAFGTVLLGREELVLVLVLAPALALFQIGLTLFQGVGAFRGRSALIVANAVATAGATAAALAVRQTLGAALVATAVAYLVVGSVGLAWFVSRHGFRAVGIARVRTTARAGRGLWLNSLITFVTASGDVLLAALVLPLASVGYYQVFKKLALVAFAPLTTLLAPLYAHLSALSARDRARVYGRTQLLSAGLVTLSLFAGASLVPFLVRASVGPAYERIDGIFVVLVAVGALQFAHNLLGYTLVASGRYWRPLAINVGVATVALAAVVPLTRAYGLDGFLGALVAANTCGLVAAVALANRSAALGAARMVATTTAALALATLWALWAIGHPVSATLPLGAALAAGVAAIGFVRGLNPLQRAD